MINLEKQTLILFGEEHPIVKWEVWFQTPTGLADKLEDAITSVMKNDFSPNLTIRPVTVATDSAGRYELVG